VLKILAELFLKSDRFLWLLKQSLKSITLAIPARVLSQIRLPC
jgi:hypothetical protein